MSLSRKRVRWLLVVCTVTNRVKSPVLWKLIHKLHVLAPTDQETQTEMPSTVYTDKYILINFSYRTHFQKRIGRVSIHVCVYQYIVLSHFALFLSHAQYNHHVSILPHASKSPV